MKPRVPFPRTILRCLLLPALAQTAFAQTIHYVAIASTNPVPPYITWATAATNIQDAIDVSVSNDTVLVSNGVYATGGRTVNGWALTNRIAITNAISVQSVNGPSNTTIMGQADPQSIYSPLGDAAVRCAYIGTNAFLSGFTLISGYTRVGGSVTNEQDGGGLFGVTGAVVSNCMLSGNKAFYEGGGAEGGTLINCTLISNTVSNSKGGGAHNSTLNSCILMGNWAPYGGGSYNCTLNNCTLSANSAGIYGGAASHSTLRNCVLSGNWASTYIYASGGGSYTSVLINCILVGNSATYSGGGSYNSRLISCTLTRNSAGSYGGGALIGELINCIAYDNSALMGGPNFRNSSLSYCCATPFAGGVGNITNDPQFVDSANSNFHLKATSPCIDRGNYAYATNSATDLDGNPRIMYGTVDMGAYEFQSPAGYWQWALAITNGLTNYTDSATADGYANLMKYATGSSPTNSDALARLNALRATNGHFALAFNRNTNANDVTLIVEGGDAMTNGVAWNGIATNFLGSWGGATNVIESGTSTPVVVTVHDTAPPAANCFLRLRVTRP